MENNRKLLLFIAMSLDGFIAKKDGDISFLSQVEKEGEDYGYSTFLKSVDTIILGRKTYDKILSMGIELPYGSSVVYVLTRSPKPNSGRLHFYSGDLSDLILNLKCKEGKHIYCDGGSETIHQLLVDDLIDEMVISIIPVMLGEGIPLFKEGFQQNKLRLEGAESFEKGLVQLHYIRE
ncbi:MAG TPA: dihydrofolate reductase [Prolixibacteraceae bacterium]|nr:dihydrofolate reductase [Prolixibacteraceae bacterium]